MTTVLLDLDGTLSDNFVGISRSIRHALSAMGVADPGDAVLRTCVGPPLRESFARLVPGADPAAVEEAIGHYRHRYRDVGWRENVAYAGVAEALAELASRGVLLYVCTSKPEVFAARIVGHFGFDAHIVRTYGADLEGRLDDKRNLLAHVLERESIAAAQAVMVGDRHHDIRAALANGVRAVGVLWGYGHPDELAGAQRLLAHPRELATLA